MSGFYPYEEAGELSLSLGGPDMQETDRIFTKG